MAFLDMSKWSDSVKLATGAVTSIAIILGGYFSVEVWAESKIAEAERRVITTQIEMQVRNEIDHSKMEQSQRLETAETRIVITELELANVEESIEEREDEGKQPTLLQQKKMERLMRVLETYESVQEDAERKLTKITTTTITTTEETQ